MSPVPGREMWDGLIPGILSGFLTALGMIREAGVVGEPKSGQLEPDPRGMRDRESRGPGRGSQDTGVYGGSEMFI